MKIIILGVINEKEQIKQKPKFIDGQNVKYAGIVVAIKKKYTRNNKIMAFITIEDLYGTTEIIAFENVCSSAGDILKEEEIIIVEGRLSIREDEKSIIIANKIQELVEEKILKLNITKATEEEKEKLRILIRNSKKEKNNIKVQIKINEEIRSCGEIYFTEENKKLFIDILGEDNIIIES